MARQQLFLPDIDYGQVDNFSFPILTNSLNRYPLAQFNPWGSGLTPCHCFVDDWRIESIWRDKYMMLSKFVGQSNPVVISPDFTVEEDYPLPLAFYQVWRSRVIAKYWQSCGVYVVPALQWSRPSINHHLFQGLSDCEVVAVRSPTKGYEKPWCDVARQYLAFNTPKLVLHFGTSRGIRVWGDIAQHMNLSNRSARV